MSTLRLNPNQRATVLRELAEGGDFVVDVAGTSMLPTLRPSDRLRISSQRHPRPGEVGLFVSAGGDLVVHRTVGRLFRTWVFIGDDRTLLDRPVDTDRVVGVATHVLKGPITEPIAGLTGLGRVALAARIVSGPLRGLVNRTSGLVNPTRSIDHAGS